MTNVLRSSCLGVFVLAAGLFASPAAGQSILPTAPSGAEVQNLGDGERALVRWTDNSSNETGFHILRENYTGTGWAWPTVITAAMNATSLTDSPGPGPFRYRIRAFNGSGTSIFTDPPVQVNVTATVPAAPTNLTFLDLGDGLRAQNSWTDTSLNETGFELQREKQDTSGGWIGTVTLTAGANVTVINNMPGPGTLRYRIRSVNSAGASAWSAWIVGVVAPVTGGTVPAAPGGISAVDLGTGGEALVQWTDLSNNETGFTLQREVLSGSTWGGAVNINAAANATSRTDAPGAGTFRYRVRSYNLAGFSAWTSWAQVTVGLNLPAAPSGLSFLDLGDGLRARLSWTDHANTESGFEIQRERQDSSGGWGSLATLTAGANVTVINNMPGAGTYRFRIRSVNGAGGSAWSGWIVGVIANVIPPAPSEIAAVDMGNGVQSRVTWADNSLNETGFEIERWMHNGSVWVSPMTVLMAKNYEELVDAPGLGTYRYRVRAVNGAGGSAWTGWAWMSVASVTPAQPSGLGAVDLGNGLQAKVTWIDNSGNESGFELERQTQSGTAWGPVSTMNVAANLTQHTDSPGQGTHRYRVRATNTFGASAYTPWVSVEVNSPLPAAPTTLAALDMGNGSQVRLTWQDTSTNETGFQIERSTQSGSTWISAITWNAPANAVIAFDEAGLGTFRYRVRSVNTFGSSAFSAWAVVTVAAQTPAAPTGLTVTDLGNGSQARLNWQDHSSNETAFQIERQTQSGSAWGPSATFAASANVTQYTDAPGVGVHRYRVRSVNGFGWSAYTPWVNVTVQTATPAAPTGLTAVDAGNRKALVSWTDTSSNETSFQIQRQPAFPGVTVSVSANVTGYLDSCGAGTFQYRVRSANAQGASAWTGWVSVVVSEIPPAAPSGLTATDMGNQNTIRLAWMDNSDNETGFEIERQTQSGATWGNGVSLTSAANTTTKDDNAGLGTHRYRLRAVNAVGQSAWTAWVTVITAQGGWTVLSPSLDTRTVYVSSSQGNDSNTGLTEAAPKKTIAAGKSLLRNGFPDWLLLRKGDTWTNESLGEWQKSGRSLTEPMVISTYGASPARALLKTGVEGGFTRLGGVGGPATLKHITIVGLHFVPHLYNGSSNYASGIGWFGPGENFLVEDCFIEGYQDNMVLMADVSNRAKNIRVRRCVIVDSFVVGQSPNSQGMFVDGVEGLLVEECVIDHNGWSETVPGAVQNVFRQNAYLQSGNTGVVFRRNISARAAHYGVAARSGGIVEDNIFVRNPMSVLFGGGDDPVPGGVTGTIRGNAFFEGTTVAGEPRGVAINLMNISSQGVLVEDNIMAHNAQTYPNAWACAFMASGWGSGVGVAGATFRDNVIYKWNGGLQFDTPQAGAVLTNINVLNNFFHDTQAGANRLACHNGGSLNQAAFDFQGNRYQSALSAAQWFEIGGNTLSFPQWAVAAGEVGSVAAPSTLADPTRTLATYNASLGGTGTLQAFLNEARKQSKGNWRAEYTTAAVLQYIRAGYSSN